MNKRIVVLLSAALILAFTSQVNAVFVVLSPVPDPSPTPTTRISTPLPIIEVTRVLIDRRDVTPEPVSDYSKSSYHFEFRLGNLVNWDDIWEMIEAWLERQG